MVLSLPLPICFKDVPVCQARILEITNLSGGKMPNCFETSVP